MALLVNSKVKQALIAGPSSSVNSSPYIYNATLLTYAKNDVLTVKMTAADDTIEDVSITLSGQTI